MVYSNTHVTVEFIIRNLIDKGIIEMTAESKARLAKIQNRIAADEKDKSILEHKVLFKVNEDQLKKCMTYMSRKIRSWKSQQSVFDFCKNIRDKKYLLSEYRLQLLFDMVQKPMRLEKDERYVPIPLTCHLSRTTDLDFIAQESIRMKKDNKKNNKSPQVRLSVSGFQSKSRVKKEFTIFDVMRDFFDSENMSTEIGLFLSVLNPDGVDELHEAYMIGHCIDPVTLCHIRPVEDGLKLSAASVEERVDIEKNRGSIADMLNLLEWVKSQNFNKKGEVISNLSLNNAQTISQPVMKGVSYAARKFLKEREGSVCKSHEAIQVLSGFAMLGNILQHTAALEIAKIKLLSKSQKTYSKHIHEYEKNKEAKYKKEKKAKTNDKTSQANMNTLPFRDLNFDWTPFVENYAAKTKNLIASNREDADITKGESFFDEVVTSTGDLIQRFETPVQLRSYMDWLDKTHKVDCGTWNLLELKTLPGDLKDELAKLNDETELVKRLGPFDQVAEYMKLSILPHDKPNQPKANNDEDGDSSLSLSSDDDENYEET